MTKQLHDDLLLPSKQTGKHGRLLVRERKRNQRH